MNYMNIARALDFYQDRGYVYLDDAPWHVGIEAYGATKPPGAKDVIREVRGEGPRGDNVCMERSFPVASGEQSFLQMMFDGQPIKRAICVTPCHRAEPRVDTLHRPYFMKAELINAQDVDMGHLVDMVSDAKAFFESMGISVRIVETTPSPQRSYLPTFDIVEKGSRYELGSYGIRQYFRKPPHSEHRQIQWIYGTACAEPRLSTAVQKALKAVGR